MMSIEVIYMLEFIEVDVDESKDPSVLARLQNLPIQMLVQREAIVNVCEQVELGAMGQIGVEAAVLDGQSG